MCFCVSDMNASVLGCDKVYALEHIELITAALLAPAGIPSNIIEHL